MSPPVRFWLLVVAALPVITIAPLPAHAALPGRDGLIAFASSYEGDDCPFSADGMDDDPCTNTIYRVKSSGHAQRRLSPCGTTAEPACAEGDPAWSPDGKRIAFDRGGEIWVMNAAGGDRRAIGVDGAEPAWSRDGRRIVYRNIGSGDLGLATVKLDGTGFRQLTSYIGDSQPTWSARGLIAFVHYENGHQGIVTMTSSGKQRRTVLRDCACDHPDFSPDGRLLAYAAGSASQLFVARPDGSHRHQLTRSGGTEPAWAPSGRYLAYQRNDDIYVIHSDGTRAHRIAYNPKHDIAGDVTGDYGQPAWQPLPPG
jgi:Tol biopolymer transport system component